MVELNIDSSQKSELNWHINNWRISSTYPISRIFTTNPLPDQTQHITRILYDNDYELLYRRSPQWINFSKNQNPRRLIIKHVALIVWLSWCVQRTASMVGRRSPCEKTTRRWKGKRNARRIRLRRNASNDIGKRSRTSRYVNIVCFRAVGVYWCTVRKLYCYPNSVPHLQGRYSQQRIF